MVLTDKNITDSYADWTAFKPGDRVVFRGINESFRSMEFEGEVYEVVNPKTDAGFVQVKTLGVFPTFYQFLKYNLKLHTGAVETPDPKSPRQQLLEGAIKATTKERNNEYGPPTQDFDRTARLATELGFKFAEKDLEPHHVAMFMILLKLSRITWDPEKEDNWMDIAGYAGCGFECVVEGEDD